jgi:hypothetical protein
MVSTMAREHSEFAPFGKHIVMKTSDINCTSSKPQCIPIFENHIPSGSRFYEFSEGIKQLGFNKE